jgi:hypothetical protein
VKSQQTRAAMRVARTAADVYSLSVFGNEKFKKIGRKG